MSSPLGDFVMIRFQATADTPQAAQALHDQVFYFPPEYLTAIGSGAGNPGVITAAGQKIRGYLDSTNPTDRRWVMTNEMPPAAQAQVDAIPGGLGWVRPASRTLYVNQGRALIAQYGVPVPDVIALWTALYRAAALNRDAQIEAGG